jgi:hypothetical protein
MVLVSYGNFTLKYHNSSFLYFAMAHLWNWRTVPVPSRQSWTLAVVAVVAEKLLTLGKKSMV